MYGIVNNISWLALTSMTSGVSQTVQHCHLIFALLIAHRDSGARHNGNSTLGALLPHPANAMLDSHLVLLIYCHICIARVAAACQRSFSPHSSFVLSTLSYVYCTRHTRTAPHSTVLQHSSRLWFESWEGSELSFCSESVFFLLQRMCFLSTAARVCFLTLSRAPLCALTIQLRAATRHLYSYIRTLPTRNHQVINWVSHEHYRSDRNICSHSLPLGVANTFSRASRVHRVKRTRYRLQTFLNN